MKYSPAFLAALAFTLPWEGGVSDRKNDRGGLTNMGVTQRTFNEYCDLVKVPRRDVRTITVRERDDLYHRLFWIRARCEELPVKLAIAVFDFAVNSGPGRARRYLALAPRGYAKDPSKYVEARRGFLKRLALLPSQREFKRGWMNRLDALLKEVA